MSCKHTRVGLSSEHNKSHSGWIAGYDVLRLLVLRRPDSRYLFTLAWFSLPHSHLSCFYRLSHLFDHTLNAPSMLQGARSLLRAYSPQVICYGVRESVVLLEGRFAATESEGPMTPVKNSSDASMDGKKEKQEPQFPFYLQKNIPKECRTCILRHLTLQRGHRYRPMLFIRNQASATLLLLFALTTCDVICNGWLAEKRIRK